MPEHTRDLLTQPEIAQFIDSQKAQLDAQATELRETLRRLRREYQNLSRSWDQLPLTQDDAAREVLRRAGLVVCIHDSHQQVSTARSLSNLGIVPLKEAMLIYRSLFYSKSRERVAEKVWFCPRHATFMEASPYPSLAEDGEVDIRQWVTCNEEGIQTVELTDRNFLPIVIGVNQVPYGRTELTPAMYRALLRTHHTLPPLSLETTPF